MKRRYRRRARRPVRRVRRVYVRRKRFVRRGRRPRRFVHTQNCVKYHCKHYETGIMEPYVTDPEGADATSLQKFQTPLWVSKFTTGNLQFERNLVDYHFLQSIRC